jgi:hypothetical protein
VGIVSSSFRGRKVEIRNLAYPPPLLGDIKVLSAAPPTLPLLRPPTGEPRSPQRRRVPTGPQPSSSPPGCCNRHLEMLQSVYIDVVINVPFHADVLMSQSLNFLGCCKCLSSDVTITANRCCTCVLNKFS